MNKDLVLECKNLSRVFVDGKSNLKVLSDVNLEVKRGSQIAIMGRSGSGKSTLLQLLGGLDLPTTGHVVLNGKDLTKLSADELARWRNKTLGFIYQMHHLLPEFSALENIAMPLLIAGVKLKVALAQAGELIAAVGLNERAEHRPAQLSGGERQRIAIARSLAMSPDCVLADEPTGNLDVENAELTLQLLQKLNRERGTTFIIVTHDAELAARLDCTYHLQDGMLK